MNYIAIKKADRLSPVRFYEIQGLIILTVLIHNRHDVKDTDVSVIIRIVKRVIIFISCLGIPP